MLKRKQKSNVILSRATEDFGNETETVEVETAQIIQKVKPQNYFGLCPICVEELKFVNRLHFCTKCRKQYVRRSRDAELIDCVLLPYGYCRCCDQAFPLIKIINTEDLLCPVSRERYFSYSGNNLRSKELPLGLCSCCQIATPLITKADGAIYCNSGKQEYMQNNGSIVRKPIINFATNTDVETALNEGMAAFYYGGFIGTQEHQTPEPPTTPTRKRRK